MVEHATRRKWGPVGEGESVFYDANGDAHLFEMYSFSNTYDLLTFGVHKHRTSRFQASLGERPKPRSTYTPIAAIPLPSILLPLRHFWMTSGVQSFCRCDTGPRLRRGVVFGAALAWISRVFWFESGRFFSRSPVLTGRGFRDAVIPAFVLMAVLRGSCRQSRFLAADGRFG